MALLRCSIHHVTLIRATHWHVNSKGHRVVFTYLRCPVNGCRYKRADKYGRKNRKR